MPLAARSAVLFALLAGGLAAFAPGGAPAAEHVIHVSIDGLSGTRLQSLVASDPTGDFGNFARLASEGAGTYNARSDYTHTITLPNHTTMLTGRPVSQPSGLPNTIHHGWTSNSDPTPGQTLHNAGNPNLSYVASTFDVAHDRGLSTALYASKSKFVLFERSYNATAGAPDPIPPNHGTDKIDRYLNTSPTAMHAALLTEMAANRYGYAFVHYATVDDVGHASGWGSPAWNDAVREIDDALGDLFDLIEGDPVLAGSTLLILSADHGGTGTGHDSATNAANYTIPFFVWGDGVQPGADLYALNAATRANPGTGRPSYTAALQPIRNGDGANLALAALGLPAVPGSSINATQPLATETPPPAVVCGDGNVGAGEQCDDGGTAAGDCCGATCQYEAAGSACDDGNACTISSCSATGTCHPGPALVCDDGLFCDGVESCVPATGCAAGTPPAVADALACTFDSCDEASDRVVHAPVNAECADGGPCVVGRCDVELGCVQEQLEGCVATVPALERAGQAALALALALLGVRRRLRA